MFKNRFNRHIAGLLSLPLLLAGLVLTPAALAQPSNAGSGEPSRNQQIYEMAFQALAGEGVPGYAIAIVKDGATVFRATFGMADMDAKKKVTKDTIFGLASVTKTFTALAVLHLIDEGKIKASDTLDKYLKNLPPAWQKLTIQQLASMRAGLPASRGDELPWPEEMPYLESQPLANQPNSTFVYSNPSYRVLGTVIESVTGMSYMDYISQVILQPIGMRSTGTTESMAETGRVSCQYRPGQGGSIQIKPKNPMTSFSAGMLASSLDDMCAYATALLNHKILSEASYKTYFFDRPNLPSGAPSPWAWGWASKLHPKLDVRVVAMNGGLPGVASTVILLPDQNVAVVALSNQRSKPVYQIAKRAMGIFLCGADSGPAPPDEGGQSEPSGGGADLSSLDLDMVGESANCISATGGH